MINETKKTTGNNRFYEIPRAEVIVFDCKDIITTSGAGGIDIHHEDNDERWNTPKINGGN